MASRSVGVGTLVLLTAACTSRPDAGAGAAELPQRYTLTAGAAPLVVRQGHTATLLPDGSVLVAGGTAANVAQARAELYDPRTGRFAATGSMAQPRAHHTATLLPSGRVLLHGGAASNVPAELYDWRTHDFAPAAIGSVARSHHTATLLPSGEVLVIGGHDGTSTHALTERYTEDADTFTPDATLTARHSHTTSLLGDGRLLIYGGYLSLYGLATVSAELLDPTTGTATLLPFPDVAGEPIGSEPDGSVGPTSRARHTATVLANGQVLVLAGFDGATVRGTTPFGLRFDPAQNRFWPGPTTDARCQHSASLLPSGQVVALSGTVGGTLDGGSVGNESYDVVTPDGTAASRVSPTTVRVDHTSTVLPTGNTVVIGGGVGSEHLLLAGPDFGALTTLEISDLDLVSLTPLPGGDVLALSSTSARRFDPAANAYTPTGSPTGNRAAAAATLLRDGTVLITGGGSPTTSEVYDPRTGVFTSGPALTVGRAQHSSTLLPSGRVLLVGGSGQEASQSAEVYEPATGTFIALDGTTSAPRTAHRAVLLATGQVLIVGGAASPGTAELYDEAGTFTPTGALVAQRTHHTVTLLASGRVLVAGAGTFVDSAELYDPATNSFTATARLAETEEQSATLLPTGQVLIAGGANAEDPYSVSRALWLFDPVADGGNGAFLSTPAEFQRRLHHAAPLSDGDVLLASGTMAKMTPVLPGVLADARFSGTFDALRRPALTAAPARVVPGTTVPLAGSGLVGPTDASSGTTNASASNYPIAVWQPLSGQGLVYGSVTHFTDTSADWTVPATALHGPGRLHVIVNGIPSAGVDVLIDAAELATACTHDADCASGFCTDGLCCDTRCAGECRACTAALKGSGADGACGDVPPGQSATDDCELGNGAGCADAEECASGNCVDGVCCNEPCVGQCEACDVANSRGQCVAVSGAPHSGSGTNRAPCAEATSDGPCTARRCDGDDRATCAGYVGGDTECAPARCDAGQRALAAACDGRGACAEQTLASCAPWGCSGATCGSGPCADDDDCHPDYVCRAGDCVVPSATCDDEHTLLLGDGTTEDCAPYRCAGSEGECLTRCGSALDCVQGHACSARGACVPDDALAADARHCSTHAPPRERPPGWLLVLGLTALRRRRRQNV